ncbi:MAG: DUF547 domain-containing protein [Chitinophagaceae bacterium]|nr:DUF547 domain-containing protein [Chitinophagaceae bacterium]
MNIYTFALALFELCGSFQQIPQQENTKPISHEQYNSLLLKYVDTEGWVDYDGLKKQRDILKNYINSIQKNPPNDTHWSKNEQLAYWINAYNAITLDIVLDYYPIESIKDIGSIIKIPLINTAWDIPIKIGNQEITLNFIEHSILRKKFQEPRIHFAINCASYSCPALRNEAFIAATLETQLQEQAVSFINDPKRNKINKTEAQISELFQWFAEDFTRKGSLYQFLNLYSFHTIHDKTKISYLNYDWRLNKKGTK